MKKNILLLNICQSSLWWYGRIQPGRLVSVFVFLLELRLMHNSVPSPAKLNGQWQIISNIPLAPSLLSAKAKLQSQDQSNAPHASLKLSKGEDLDDSSRKKTNEKLASPQRRRLASYIKMSKDISLEKKVANKHKQLEIVIKLELEKYPTAKFYQKAHFVFEVDMENEILIVFLSI